MQKFISNMSTLRRSLLVSAAAFVVVATAAYATTIGTSVSTAGLTSTDDLTVTGAATLTADVAATIPLSVVGASAQSGNFVNVTSNGGTAGDIFKITSYGSQVITPSRPTGSQVYGVDINSDTFFTGTAAQKSYLLSVRGDRDSAAATGDSNDALVKVSGSNYAVNDANFIFRGINSAITNRGSAELGILEGASIGAQGKSGGTAPTVRGMSLTAENYGTTATEMGVLDATFRNEGGKATLQYGIRIRNNGANAGGVGDAALLVNVAEASGSWNYAIDMNGATINTAEIRLKNGETINNSTDGLITLGGNLLVAGAALGSKVASSQSTPAVVTATGGSAISCTNGAGTASTCTDMRGQARATTANDTAPIVVTFNVAYTTAPVCVITAGDGNTAAAIGAAGGVIVTTSTSALTITPAGAWGANAKIINYVCIQ